MEVDLFLVTAVIFWCENPLPAVPRCSNQALVLKSKTRCCSYGFSCRFCMKGQEYPSGVLSKPAITYHLGGWPGKTLWMLPFHLGEVVVCNGARNSSWIHVLWTKMWLIGMIVFLMEWFVEPSYKIIIVMTSWKCKLNWKQPEPGQPSRTFNHLEMF